MRFPVAHQQFHWHLELSSKCALRCPRCPRTEKPGQYKVTELSLETIQRVFTPEYVQHHMLKLLLCGGQGDPIYNTRFLDIIRHFKSCKPSLQITITTNGSHKKAAFWSELRGLLTENDVVTFSVDGWDQDSNVMYRAGSDYASILEGVRTLAGGPARVRWTTIVFKFNQDQLERVRDVAKEAGADEFTLTLSALFGSRNPSYIDPALGFDPLEPDAQFVSALERTQRLVHRLSGRSPEKGAYRAAFEEAWNQVSDHADKTIAFPLCRAGNRGLYVDAEGILYPCSWVSHPFGLRKSSQREKQISAADGFWRQYRDHFDIHQHSLTEILADDVWAKLERGWSDKDKLFIECEQKCGAGKCGIDDLRPRKVTTLPNEART